MRTTLNLDDELARALKRRAAESGRTMTEVLEDALREALAWLRRLAEGDAAWGLPVFCLGEFLRIETHPKVFALPASLDQARAALAAVLASPSVRVLSPGSRYPSLLAACASEADARGNLAFDAQIAAVCLEHGATRLLTLDRDFSRFPGIDVLSPAAPPP